MAVVAMLYSLGSVNLGRTNPPPQMPPQLSEVFEKHGPYVHRALRYFGVPDADLSDVFQEVFVIVHRKLDEFEGRASIRTWLYRICQRAASDYRKRAYVRREVVAEAPQSLALETTTEDGARLEARRLLLHALSQLDDDKRQVFVLFEIEGMTMKEVCEVVDCPLQTAYSRLHAARKLVADAVREAQRGAA